MIYQVSFFQLQLDFAEAIAKAKGNEFSRALLEYTTIFRLLGGDTALWDEYLNGLKSVEKKAEFTAEFVQIHQFIPQRERFGCFSYGLEENETRLRIHFENLEGKGALSKARVFVRQEEIRAMIKQALEKYPRLESVRGGSWLYNLEAYWRLFPPEFVASPSIQEEEFQFLALWGQCLSGDGEANPKMSAYVLEKAANLGMDDDIQTCFPYQVLGCLGKMSDFEDFYR